MSEVVARRKRLPVSCHPATCVGDHKAAKQAEFLVHGHVPWSLIERIGVLSRPAADQVSEITSDTARVRVEVRPEWYY